MNIIITYDGVVDKELDKVEDDQDGDESIEMNIKAEAPLNVLISEIWFQQELVRHKPETCGNHQTNLDNDISLNSCWLIILPQ